MLSLSDWESLHQRKLDWAYEARENLVKDMKSSDIFYFEDHNSESEMMISVYGKSQRGKTTCILSLLGIKEEEILTVSDILRGSRRRGTSATSTATAYKRAASDLFGLAYGNIVFQELRDEAFKDKMDEIRAEIEMKPGSIDQITVFIPNKYFNEITQSHKYRIVDLPGIESAEEKEREHVTALVERYFKSSDSVLVVELANSLTDLGQISFAKQGLEIWSSRFKVILTRSLSLESVKNMILGQSEKDIYETLMDYYREEVNRSLFGKIERNLEIYPMEFGESLLEFTAAYPEYKDVILGVLKRLRSELLTSISETLTMEDKLMESVNMANSIKNRVDEKKLEKEKFLENLKKKIDRSKTYLFEENGIRSIITDLKIKLETSEEIVQTLSGIVYSEDLKNVPEAISIFYSDTTRNPCSVSDGQVNEKSSITKKELDLITLKIDLIKIREKIRKDIKEELYDNILEPIRKLEISICDKLIKVYEKKIFLNEEMDLDEVDLLIDSIFISHFFRKKLSKDFNTKLQESHRAYHKRYFTKTYLEIPKLIERVQKILQKDIITQKLKIFAFETDIKMKIISLANLETVKNTKEIEFDALIQQYEADAKVVVKFQAYLDVSYKKEYKRVMTEINLKNNTFWNLFHLKLITEKHQYFTNKLENKYGKTIG